jgi:hypothetical protein
VIDPTGRARDAAAAPVELGVGAARTLSGAGRGRVVAVFRRAAYLRLPAGLVALVAPDVWPGPLHVRSTLRPDLLAPGDPVVVVAGSHVVVGRSHLDLGRSRVWEGPLPDPAALARASSAASGLAAGVLAGAPPSALREPAYGDRLAVALRRLAHDDLVGVATAIGGLGPGLTPAGDDALAGILLVARTLGGTAVEPRLLAVARSSRTTSVASAFLEWAARGQSVAPVHDLLVALAAGDGPGAARHLTALQRLGHTSGADLAYGLALGLGLGLEVQPRRAEVGRVSPC